MAYCLSRSMRLAYLKEKKTSQRCSFRSDLFHVNSSYMRGGLFLMGYRVRDWLRLTPPSGFKHRRGLKQLTVPTGTGTGIRQTALGGQHERGAAVQRLSSDPNDEGCAEGGPIVADCSAVQRGPLTMSRGTIHKSAQKTEEKRKHKLQNEPY